MRIFNLSPAYTADPAARVLGLDVLSAQPGSLVPATPEVNVARLRRAGAGQWTVALRELLPAPAAPGIYAVRLQTTNGVKTVRLAYTGC